MDGYQTKAYAKINLGLDVVKRLPNGYHQVKMIMQNIGIHDELTFEKAEHAVTILTDSEELPTDKNNLIHKAAGYMFDKYSISSGLRVRLRKNIPIAAGLAGGSADAAATMKGINILFGLGLSTEELMENGSAIGADVPYCILGGTALAEGIGEKLTPLPPIPACHILIAKPDINVSTKYVYEHLDLQALTRHPDIDGMTESIKSGQLEGITKRMENVLETVTIPAYPVIADIKERMLCLGAENSLMSGSGPTVFGIFRNRNTAEHAYGEILASKLARQVFLTRQYRPPERLQPDETTNMLQERHR